MRYSGYSVRRVSDLCLPDEATQLTGDPTVRLIVATYPSVGLLHAPIVRGRDNMVVSGVRRVVALTLLGVAEVRCKMVDCSDRTMRIIRCIENGCRDTVLDADCRKELTAAALSSVESIYSSARKYKLAPVSAALGLVARATGLSPRTVLNKRSSRRVAAAKSLVERIQGVVDMKKDRSPVVSFGHEDLAVLANISSMRMHMLGWRSALAAMQKSLKTFETAHLVPHQQMARLFAALKQLQDVMAAMTPVSVCPNCKGLPAVQAECVACDRAGWIGYLQQQKVPPLLMREPVVTYRGKVCPVSQITGGTSAVSTDASGS